MQQQPPPLSAADAPHPAVGIGWRREIDLVVEDLPGLGFVEVVAENLHVCDEGVDLPVSLRVLRERGVPVVPHGVALGLGGARRPDPERLARLARVARALDAPLVSEHLAFVRAGDLEAGHLLPVPYTRDALDVVAENVRIAQEALPVPLALENPATLFRWPEGGMTQSAFLAELVARTGVRLLLDVANLHTEHVNHGVDPRAALDALPLEAVAYVHIAGGVRHGGLWHDTHAHPVPREALDILAELCARRPPPGVLLERDDAYPPPDEIAAELDAVRAVVRRSPAPAPAAWAAVPERPAAPVSDTSRARRELARAQQALLGALVARAPAPPGFDAARLRAQADSLAVKRRSAEQRRGARSSQAENVSP